MVLMLEILKFFGLINWFIQYVDIWQGKDSGVATNQIL